MRRLVINSLLIMLALFTTVPVFAADANYDSNGVTAFYGKYEYPKDEPEKEQPLENEEGTIIPATGDTSNLFATLSGFFLLSLVFFKLKEEENGEKNSII